MAPVDPIVFKYLLPMVGMNVPLEPGSISSNGSLLDYSSEGVQPTLIGIEKSSANIQPRLKKKLPTNMVVNGTLLVPKRGRYFGRNSSTLPSILTLPVGPSNSDRWMYILILYRAKCMGRTRVI